eukprot:g5868.t1
MLRRAWLVALLFVPVTIGAAYIAFGALGVNTDTSSMVSDDLPWRVARAEYAKAFPDESLGILILIEGGSRELRESKAVELVGALRARADLFLHAESPAEDPFFRRHGLLYRDVGGLESMEAALRGSVVALASLRRDPSIRGVAPLLMAAVTAPADQRPEGLGGLLREAGGSVEAARLGIARSVSWREQLMGGGADGRVLVLARPVLDYSAIFPAGAALDALDQIGKDLGLDGARGVSMRVTGEAALATDELRSASEGAGIATGVAMLGVLVVLYIGLQSFRMMIACTITLVVGLIGTAAFAGVAVGDLNLISVAFAVLYIGLGIDYAIHICMRYREAVVGGRPHGAAVLVSLRQTGPALAVCAVTTSVGFFAFIPTAFKGVSELGLIAGVGMFIGLVVNLLLLPSLLVLFGRPMRYGTITPLEGPRAGIVGLPERRRWVFRGLGVVGAVVALVMAPRVVFDQNRLNLQDPARESVGAFNELMETGDPAPYALNMLAPAGEPAEALRGRLGGLDSVRHARTVSSFVPADQDAKLAVLARMRSVLAPVFSSEPREVPDAEGDIAALRSLRAGLLGLDTGDAGLDAAGVELRRQIGALLDALEPMPVDERERVLLTLREGLLGSFHRTMASLEQALTADRVTLATLPESIRERWIARDGRWRVEASPDEDLNENAAIWRFAREVLSVAPDAVGEPVSGLRGGRVIVGAFVQAFVTALIAIFILVLVLLRSVRDALVVLAPLLLAGGLTGAASVWFGTPFNFANIIALPLMLGVGVDSGIHMVHRARYLPSTWAWRAWARC